MGKLILILGIILLLYTPVSYVIGRQEAESEMQYREGQMGEIVIPAIDVHLPIYKGTEEETLSKGIGFLEESSPLTGEENSHSILAGHRGLPNAAMFLRLDELKEGDIFFLYVSGRELQYEVCEIQIILPTQTGGLGVKEGKNLVSLVTCTPYGINTHRLVVTGERKE